MTNDNQTLGQKIKAARKARTISQQQLAAETGVPQTTISSWENDEKIPLYKKVALNKVLDFLEIPRA